MCLYRIQQLSKSVSVESAMTVSCLILAMLSFQLYIFHNSGHFFVVAHGVNGVQAEIAHFTVQKV